jgi:hypothetical protein
MDHMHLSDELRNQLLEAAEWGKVGITPVNRIDEGDTPKTHADMDDHEDGVEELKEAVHVCPLCTSELDEQISEESLLEHLDIVLGLVDRLSQINEGDEDMDEVIDTALEDLLLGNTEEEEAEEEEKEAEEE